MRRCKVWLVISFFWLSIIGPLSVSAQDSQKKPSFTKETIAMGSSVDWAAIETLDLDTTVAIALSGNPGLKAAVARVHQAKAQIGRAHV